MIEKFFTTDQVANILQVHPFTILKFIREGKLKGVKLGRVYRIKESDVQDFLESRTTQPKKKAVEKVVEEVERHTPIEQKSRGDDHYYII